MYTRIIYSALSALVILGIAASSMLFLEHRKLAEEITTVRTALSQEQVRTEDLEYRIAQKDEQIEAHKEFIRVFRQQQNGVTEDFAQMRVLVEQATQTIEDIRKLEEADPELLAKYSKVYFLNEHYTPDTLAFIPSEFVLSSRPLQIKEEVRPFLVDMLSAMETAGLSPRVVSAYRSFDYQGEVKHRHTVEYGTSAANTFSADQGYSEHQLGTAVDLSNTELGGALTDFDKTAEYAWLLAHAHKYGFTLSYPPDNAYYIFEPWHWRFVGVALATHLSEEGLHFYDMPQRDIDAYRVTMFER